jgi:hypothetical protein
MCLTGDGCRNFSDSLSILGNFLRAIEAQPNPNRSVDNLIEQLTGDDNLFARIVLFSTRGPKRREIRNVFVDWIMPDTVISVPAPGIDGYFLSLSSGSGDMDVQIRRLMKIITSELRIFNVEISADISGYKLARKDYRCSTAIRHFHQTFHLTPSKFGTTALALLGVEVKFIHFTADGACEKTIWMSKSFKKSNDFIPVCSTINHWLLIPVLCDAKTIEEFIGNLRRAYETNCLLAIAGANDDPDDTFSTLPVLQWFLLALFGRPPQFRLPMCPIYCDLRSRLSHYYPSVSYWEGQDNCIAENAHMSWQFWRLLGEPEIAVIDCFYTISVFGTESVAPDSQLDGFLTKCLDDRFPQPPVEFYSAAKLVALLQSSDVRAKMEHSANAAG